MRRIFTKKGLIQLARILMLLTSFSIPSYGSDYKPIIRYDRVWENKTRYYNDQGLIRCVRFDGPEEINGKTYHRVVTFKKSHWESGDIQAYVTEDCYELEGYLREENGVVYALVYEDYNMFDEPYLGGTCFPETKEGDEPLSYKEYVLYDMTLNKGDHYAAFTDLCENYSCLDVFKVLHTSYIEIAGEQCKMMYVCTKYEEEYESDMPYTWYYPIIEGVGIVKSGCLNFLTIEGHKNTGMMFWKCFERILDMEGNVLYCGPNYDDRLDALSYGSFVSKVESVNGAEVSDAPIYDILGRQIANPTPGQLYIQAGKKHIAK